MNKSLLAFFLACLTMSGLLSSCAILVPKMHQRPVQVSIQSDGDVRDIVTSIESLHRQDIDVHTSKTLANHGFSSLFMIPFMAAGFMLMTGLVLAFYKFYCRRLGIPPQI